MKAQAKRCYSGKPVCWSVHIRHDNQFFRLDYHTPKKAEAVWMAKMFNKALKRHDAERTEP